MKTTILGIALAVVVAVTGAVSAHAADLSLDPTFKTGLHSSGYAPGFEDVFKTGLGSVNLTPDQEVTFGTGNGSHG